MSGRTRDVWKSHFWPQIEALVWVETRLPPLSDRLEAGSLALLPPALRVTEVSPLVFTLEMAPRR